MTDEFKLSNAAEVRETGGAQVNGYLRAGWRLIAVLAVDCGESGAPSQYAVYCVAWPRGKGDPGAPLPAPSVTDATSWRRRAAGLDSPPSV